MNCHQWPVDGSARSMCKPLGPRNTLQTLPVVSGAWTIGAKGPWPLYKCGPCEKKAILPPWQFFLAPSSAKEGTFDYFSTGPPSLVNLQAPLPVVLFSFIPNLIFVPKGFLKFDSNLISGVCNETYLSGITKMIGPSFKNSLVFLFQYFRVFSSSLSSWFGKFITSQEAPSTSFESAKFSKLYRSGPTASDNCFGFILCKIQPTLFWSQTCQILNVFRPHENEDLCGGLRCGCN